MVLFDRVEQVQFLHWILDVHVKKEGGVHYAVDVFDCDLEAMKALGFGCRDFSGKIAAQVLGDDASEGNKECKDM